MPRDSIHRRLDRADTVEDIPVGELAQVVIDKSTAGNGGGEEKFEGLIRDWANSIHLIEVSGLNWCIRRIRAS